MTETNQVLTQMARMTSAQSIDASLFVCDGKGNPTAQLTEKGQRELLSHPAAFDDVSHVDDGTTHDGISSLG